MKITKRFLASILVVVMLCGILTGCKGKDEKISDGGTLNVGISQHSTINSYTDNAYTKYIQETTGVKIEFTYFSNTASEYTKQLALMASSGEKLPDVLIGFVGLGTATAYSYGEDGYFIDLTDLIAEHADAYNEHYKQLSDKTKAHVDMRMVDSETGEIYGMPIVEQEVMVDHVQSLMFINQTWLDAVGMQMPTTTDELYTVLKAFAEKDPNGNGTNDEIPMLGKDDIINYVLNAFIYYEKLHPYNVEDGKITAPFTTDEFRQGLQFLNKLCEEGLYSDLSFTTTSTTDIKNLYTPSSGEAKVGIICGHPSLRTDTTSEILDQYVAMNPLADKTGQGGYCVISDDIVTLSGFITKDCQDPVMAMKFLDFFYEDETIIRGRHGEKGVDWEEGKGLDTYGNEITTIVKNSQAFFEGSQTWGQNQLGIQTPQNYNSAPAEDNAAAQRIRNMFKGTVAMMKEAKIKEDTVRNMNYTLDEELFKEEYEYLLNNYVVEQTDLFIIGTADIDNNSTWSAYLKQLEELNISGVLKMKQTAYDRNYK